MPHQAIQDRWCANRLHLNPFGPTQMAIPLLMEIFRKQLVAANPKSAHGWIRPKCAYEGVDLES